jgi:hypothetical protein
MSQEAVAAWKDKIIPHPISTYTLKGILNIDQYELFYSHDMLPDKANTFKEKCFKRHESSCGLIWMVLISSYSV